MNPHTPSDSQSEPSSPSHLEPQRSRRQPAPALDESWDDDWDECELTEPRKETDRLWEPEEFEDDEPQPEYGDFWLDRDHRPEDEY